MSKTVTAAATAAANDDHFAGSLPLNDRCPRGSKRFRYGNEPVAEIIQGDCLATMKTFGSGTVDLIVTSPPYNIKNSTGNGLKDGRGGKWPNAGLLDDYDGHDDAMLHQDYVDWQRECLNEMMRVIPDTGAIFYNHKWRVQAGLLQGREDITTGFPVRQIIIWQGNGGFNFNPGYFLPTYEVIYLIAKPKFELAPKANALGDVWKFPRDRGNPHPASYPVELPLRCIKSTLAKVVLDPFSGSGTTGLAALELGRDFIGIEKSGKYVDQAADRLMLNLHRWDAGLNIERPPLAKAA